MDSLVQYRSYRQSHVPSPAEAAARDVVAKLRAAGHSAFLVGGCVRDVLLGREPKDFDVATSAPPDAVSAIFPAADRVGAHFGVVLVHLSGSHIEVATYRSDRDYQDGRHPGAVVFETDPREDALRRDFTINGLLADPFSGAILDFVGGRADLASGVVRAIGDPAHRFAEDHLRMLRAVRFAARFGFRIDDATAAAIRCLAPSIHRIAPERVRDEISRILTEGAARRGFEILDSTGLLHEILPEIEAMKGVAQPPEYHPEGDVWTHTMLMLEGLRNPSVELALGVLLHDVGKPGTFRVAGRIRFDGHVEKGVEIARGLLGRLRFSSEITEAAIALIAHHMRFREAPRMRESTLKRFLRLPDFEDHLELHRLDCLSSHRGLDLYDFAKAKLTELPPLELKPAPLISGHHLIGAGYRPGPSFRAALAAVEDAQLEGRIATPEEAMVIAEESLRGAGQAPPTSTTRVR